MFTVLSILLFVVAPLALLAQNGGEPPIGGAFADMFLSIPALAAAIVAITAFVKNAFGTEGLVTDIVSWGASIPLALIGWYFGWGMFAEIPIWVAILIGISTAVYVNKGYDIFTVAAGKKDATYTPKD